MGLITAEQTTAIIDSVAGAIDAANPDVVMKATSNMNYWWLLSLGVIPVVLGWWLNKRKKKTTKW